MGNKIRIKQIDLQGIISASGQVSLLSASNYVSFVTQLDTTMSSDSELAAASSSISQSIYTINRTIGSGLISGSSQLTSSYDTRYVLSGSITQTTWDNIDGKPSGLVSQSTDLTPLTSKTGSYATTGSNQFDGNQTITGSIIATSNIQTVNGYVQTNLLYNGGPIEIRSFYQPLQINSNGAGTIVNDNTDISGSLRVSGSIFSNGIGLISGSSQFTSSYDSRYVLSGSITQTTWDNIANKPSDIVSSSTQISNLGFVTGSYTTINSFNSLTQSFNSISQSFNVISGSVGTIDFSTLATTGSNSFNGSQTITGSLIVSSVAVVNGGINVPTASILSLTSGSSISVDSSGAITGSLTGSVFGIGDVVAFSASLNSRIISGSAIAGTISGSSQLTSSFDARYTLSGSVQPLPSNLVSSSAQITAFGFISSSTTIDTGSLVTTSSLNTLSSSVDSRLDTLEASIITGSPNYVQVLGDRRTGITTIGVSIISGSITTNGNPVQIMMTGDANPVNVSSWTRLQIFRNETAIGNIVQVENSSNLNVPYCLNEIDTPSAGTYSYSMRTVSGISGLFDFGESMGPTLTAVELNSKTSFPSGTISGSSQLTSSFDTRYTLSGSVQPLPTGLISGSSQLTSSFDTRYTLSSSFSSISSSFDNRFNGLVTTGSNTFSGSQIFSGSMTVTSGQIIASTITNNSSSLFLQSGSNLYVQNNGLVEITGSLIATSITGSIAATNGVISGSSQLTTLFPSKTTGAWSVPSGASTQSFTVEAGASYTMWVNGNIPNGIITWNATVTTSNTNVPVVGSQYGWYYTAGNALVLTAMPDQIIGTTNTLISSPTSYAPNTSNVFKFGITNNSGTTQTINYGYIKLS